MIDYYLNGPPEQLKKHKFEEVSKRLMRRGEVLLIKSSGLLRYNMLEDFLHKDITEDIQDLINSDLKITKEKRIHTYERK